jgi:hypothetical protein
MKSPKMTDGYSTYSKLGLSERQYVAFRIKITIVGVIAFYIAFSSGNAMGFFTIIGAYCAWVWKIDPAEQIPRERKKAKEMEARDEQIRLDERIRLARMSESTREKLIRGEVLDV